jgi:hypothetical protein
MARRRRKPVRRPQPLRPGLRDVWEPAIGVVAAYLAMAGTAAAALALLGAGRIGQLHQMVPAVVALASGGSVDLSASLGGSLPISATASGTVGVMPLGITVVGIAVLAAAFLLPLRRRPPLTGAALALRAISAIVGYLVLAGVAASMGHGTVTVDFGGRSGGKGRLSGLDGILARRHNGTAGQGGRRGLNLGNLLGDNTKLSYHTDVATTVLAGSLVVAALLAVCWLAARRTPLPDTWTAVERVRPIATAAVLVALGLLALGVLAGGVAGVASGHFGQVAGVALLGLPNVITVGLAFGLGVPWSIDTGGSLAERLMPAIQHRLPNNGVVALGSMPGHHGGVLVPVLLAMLVLLAFAVLAVVRSGPAREGHVLARAGRWAVPVGVVTAAVLPIVSTLAAVSIRLSATAFGFSLPGMALGFSGSTLKALGYGGLAGLVAGFLGSLLVDAARRLRRSRRQPAEESPPAKPPAKPAAKPAAKPRVGRTVPARARPTVRPAAGPANRSR